MPADPGPTVFDFRTLRRFPDIEADNLFAFDSADELLVQHGLAEVAQMGLRGEEVVIIGDSYGAITLAMLAAGLAGLRVHQDSVTGKAALAANASARGTTGGWGGLDLDEQLLQGARLVLLRLPQHLSALAETAEAIARWADQAVLVLAVGRVKHMTLAMNDVLAESFSEVVPQLAQRKSRILRVWEPRPAAASTGSGFPQRLQHDGGLELCTYGGVFAGGRLDIGTRVMLDAMVQMPAADQVVDLGCGSGALAASYARRYQQARVIATDSSAAAVRSAQATMVANGLADRVSVTADDAGSQIPDGWADLVLLNPPFHQGTTVHRGVGERLVIAAVRMLREGGELWTVYNSNLGYRPMLERVVGPTEQISRTPKFTLTRSVRKRR